MGNERKVSEGFVLDFYNDVQQLVNYRPAYVFKVKLILTKYNESQHELEKMEDSDRNSIIEASSTIKHWVSRTWMEYDALCEHSSEFKSDKDKIQKLFEKIDNDLIPESADVTKYSTELIKLFSKGFGAEMMSKASEKVSGLIDSSYSGEDVGGEQNK